MTQWSSMRGAQTGPLAPPWRRCLASDAPGAPEALDSNLPTHLARCGLNKSKSVSLLVLE